MSNFKPQRRLNSKYLGIYKWLDSCGLSVFQIEDLGKCIARYAVEKRKEDKFLRTVTNDYQPFPDMIKKKVKEIYNPFIFGTIMEDKVVFLKEEDWNKIRELEVKNE